MLLLSVLRSVEHDITLITGVSLLCFGFQTRMMNQSMVRGEVVVIATGARSPPFISSVSPIAVAPPPVGLPAVSPLPTTATCSTAVVGIKNAPSVARIYKSTFDCLTEVLLCIAVGMVTEVVVVIISV